MSSFFSDLKEFRNIVKSYVGSDLTKTREHMLFKVLDRFDSVLGDSPDSIDATEPATSDKHTDWGLLLKGALDFLEDHRGLLQDAASQRFRIDENIRLLIDLAHVRISKGLVDDSWNLTERIIQLAASLPDGSETQEKLTGSLVKSLWDTLDHPPLSHLGDENEYRTADGSDNNFLYPKLGMAGMPYAKTVTPQTPGRLYPDPGEVFDKLLARRGAPQEHPNKISSVLFYMATIIIHDLFRTGDDKAGKDNPISNILSTSSYLDLAPLYGNSIQEQEAVRTMKNGMLKPDTFSEQRILGFPPGVSALLVAFNRFHNHVAEELKRINEQGRFSLNTRLSQEDAEMKVDKDIFNTARLVTCGLYINIILCDYVRTILNLNYAPESTWILDPRQPFSDLIGNSDIPEATGNQVSVEFNLIYRWHPTISPRDEKWSQDFFQDLFPGRDINDMQLGDFLQGLSEWKQEIKAQKPETRTFGGLSRGSSGSFDTAALVKLITESTSDVSTAFGPHQVPVVLKLVEVLGISQARGWHVCTLNELRKYMGIKPHETFEDINPDPETQAAMKALYKEPDLVEMYPGVLFERQKDSFYPGSGLCAGPTMTRAILSDAVALVRGDRFYTLGWSPAQMTDWGFDFIQLGRPQDKLARSGKIHQLFDVAFPGHYQENSVWKLFPFTAPDEIKRIFDKQGVSGKYDFSNPV
ncbi:heme peroxidase [Aspergillus crustosus]